MDTVSVSSILRSLAGGNEERLATVLEEIYEFIVEECGDYTKIHERVTSLRSHGALTHCKTKTGADLVHADSESKIEHKHSSIKTTSNKPRVNAQFAFGVAVAEYTAAKHETTADVAQPDDKKFFDVSAGRFSFRVHRGIWKKLEHEIDRKMGGQTGELRVTWTYKKKGFESRIAATAFKLEAARWLTKQCTSTSTRKVKNPPSMNIGNLLCKQCTLPHRIGLLAHHSVFLNELPYEKRGSLEEMLAELEPDWLELFYARPPGCSPLHVCSRIK